MAEEVRSKIFGGTPLIQTPSLLFPKGVFGKVKGKRCKVNLKSLDLIAAEIIRGSRSHFLDAPVSQIPANFAGDLG